MTDFDDFDANPDFVRVADDTPSEECVSFLLDLLGAAPLDETDRTWFFSDWASGPVRSLAERLRDLAVSRGY